MISATTPSWITIQAHSSTADGLNANIALIPFLSEMRDIYLALRADPRLQDPSDMPPWCDLGISKGCDALSA